MTLRNFAAFQTDLPDDGEDDGDNWIVWPGQNVISVIRDGLIHRGYNAVEAFSQEHLGWWFWVRFEGRHTVDIQVSDLGEHQLLVAYDKPGFLQRIFRRSDTSFSDLLLALHAVLSEPPFSDVQWYTREEYERPRVPPRSDLKPGAKTPVD